MSQEIVNYTKHKGNLELGNESIECYVGTNKEGKVVRVISGRSLTKAIGMRGRGVGSKRIATHSTLNTFLGEKLIKAIENPLLIVGGPGSRMSKPTHGYEATVLIDICQAILEAKDAGALKTEAEFRYARASEVIIRGLAKVGIIALVDEATGYQADRNKKELQKLLEMYVAEELRPWVKEFPEEYYRELFKLRSWQYKPLSVKRPILVGKLTNEIIYDRMPPGVLQELKKRNPKNEKGNRKYKLHQFLSDNIGVQHLRMMIPGVVALMRASLTWSQFTRLLDRSYPRQGSQLRLFEVPDDDEEYN